MRRWLTTILLAAAVGLALWQARDGIFFPAHRPHEHDRFGTQPAEHLRQLEAFVSSFDGADDDTGDGLRDTLGLPQWVAYELRRHEGPIESGKRPGTWATDKELAAAGLAPTDDTYRYAREFRSTHPNWYVRGHLVMKYHAERIGHQAARATHTVLNAVPQRAEFNSGIWQDLECRCGAWANKYGAVWIVTGPVFYEREPQEWIGEPEKGERRVAVPDALFKVVVRESADGGVPDVLGFVYPQEDAAYERGPYPHERYLASIDSIEALTGLDFLTSMSQIGQREIESVQPVRPWPVAGEYFAEGCKRSRYPRERHPASVDSIAGLSGPAWMTVVSEMGRGRWTQGSRSGCGRRRERNSTAGCTRWRCREPSLSDVEGQRIRSLVADVYVPTWLTAGQRFCGSLAG